MEFFADIVALILIGMFCVLAYVIVCLVINGALASVFPMKWKINTNKQKFENKYTPIFKVVPWIKYYVIEKWEIIEDRYCGWMVLFTPFAWMLSKYSYSHIDSSAKRYSLEEINELDSLNNEWNRLEEANQKLLDEENSKNTHINLLNKTFEENYE